MYQDSQPAPQCRGRWRNKMCVFGLADLPALLAAPNLTVVNKVRLDKIKRVVILPNSHAFMSEPFCSSAATTTPL